MLGLDTIPVLDPFIWMVLVALDLRIMLMTVEEATMDTLALTVDRTLRMLLCCVQHVSIYMFIKGEDEW